MQYIFIVALEFVLAFIGVALLIRYEACIVEQRLQFLRRIGRHALYDIRPHGVAINYFYQNDEFSALFQHSAHLLKTVRQVWPEIHRLYCCHEVELPVFIRQLFGRSLSDEHPLVEHFGIHLLGFRYAFLRDVDTIDRS